MPILPDYLSQIDNEREENVQDNVKYKNLYLHYMSTMFSNGNASQSMHDFEFDVASDKLWNNNKLNDENSSVGILLAVKALIQLFMTPFVTTLINSFGYRIPTAFGTFILFLASLSEHFLFQSFFRKKHKFTICKHDEAYFLIFFFSICNRNKLYTFVDGTSNARCCVGLYKCMRHEHCCASNSTIIIPFCSLIESMIRSFLLL